MCLMLSSGSKGIPGVWKARTGKNGVEIVIIIMLLYYLIVHKVQ